MTSTVATEQLAERDLRNLYPKPVEPGVLELKEARVSTIVAPLDQVERLAESGSVYVWGRGQRVPFVRFVRQSCDSHTDAARLLAWLREAA